MPARTLNDFFAGFFYGQIRVDWEAKMAIPRQKSRRKGDVKKINIEGERDKEQKVIVRHATAPRRKERSTWNWYEEFTMEWSKTFITKKGKRKPK
jgi:hypothetical protein